MDIWYIILIIVGVLILLFFATCFVCFKMVFLSAKKDKVKKENDLPPGDIFEPYREQIFAWRQELKKHKQEEIFIKSFDGLTLRGVYYEHAPNAPIEIMFHGYRGYSERDLCGGLNRCIELGKNVLAVDHRAHGESDGKVITFGIKERYDVKSWAEYAYNRFGKEVKLVITGISMGASSVLMASSLNLPETVVGVVADCGFSSAKQVISLTIKKMGLPPKIFYPFVRLGGKIFGRFDVDETSAEKELAKSKIPIVLIHGDKDEIVPYEMSEINKKACKSKCILQKIEGAGHGIALLVSPEKYLQALREFEKII